MLLTHHHLDHSGLAADDRSGSGARIAATGGMATGARAYRRAGRPGARVHGATARRARGVRPRLIAVERGRSSSTSYPYSDGFETTASSTTESSSAPGARATGSSYARDTPRPTRSSSTRRRRSAFVGDHLLAEITSGAELVPRELPGRSSGGTRCCSSSTRCARRRTAARTCLLPATGRDPRPPAADRGAARVPRRRLELSPLHDAEGSTAFDIAQRVWRRGDRGDAGRPRDLGGRRTPRRPRRARARR